MTLLTPHLRRRGAKVATALAAALCLARRATAPLTAGADQLANERAEASVLAAKIDILGQQEEALSERYDTTVATWQRPTPMSPLLSRLGSG